MEVQNIVGLHSLWLPILVSSAFVFILSSIIHMMSPWHKSDYPMVENQDKVMDTLRSLNMSPGDYMVPRPKDMSDMKSAEFKAKAEKGPRVVFTILPTGPVSMSGNLIQWFLYTVVVGIFAGYVAGRALGSGAHYLQVFRLVGTTAFCAYSLALAQYSIWYGRSWMTTFKSMVDGLIYAAFTAGVFGWLWPR